MKKTRIVGFEKEHSDNKTDTEDGQKNGRSNDVPIKKEQEDRSRVNSGGVSSKGTCEVDLIDRRVGTRSEIMQWEVE